MSSSITASSALSAGVQQIYNSGLLPASINPSVLNKASASQLNQIAKSSVESQQTSELLGIPITTSSSASTANTSLLTSLIPASSQTTSSTTDPLTTAVDNALLAPGTNAANQYLQQSQATTGSQINVVG